MKQVKLWENQPDAKIHSYPTNNAGAIAAAEGLAFFASMNARPMITMQSRLEVFPEGGDGAEQAFSVSEILYLVKKQDNRVAGLTGSDRHVLESLNRELQQPI